MSIKLQSECSNPCHNCLFKFYGSVFFCYGSVFLCIITAYIKTVECVFHGTETTKAK